MPPKKATKKTTKKTTVRTTRKTSRKMTAKAKAKAKVKVKAGTPKRAAGKARSAGKAAPARAGLTERTRISRHRNVASRTIDGQEVVIVPSSRKLQMLNEVATRIWALCDGRSIGDIVETITNEYAVSRRTALRDVMEFVGEIHKRGMVEIR